MLLLPVLAPADTPVYRTVGEDGTVVFTDRPVPGGEIVESESISVIGVDLPATVVGAGEGTGNGTETGTTPAPPASIVNALSIASPPQDATLIDTGSPARVELEASPDTIEAAGLRSELWLDGERVASGDGAGLEFPMPDRGTHVLEARVLDGAGNLLAISAKRTIHVRRPIVR